MGDARHILIIDDHDSVRRALIQVVEQLYPSADITAVANGADALNSYMQYGADLLITKGHMKFMEGIDLIRALRARQATCPILIFSFDDTLGAEALAAGANRFIPAPFEFAELRQALMALLPP